MVKHIVLWKLSDQAEGHSKLENAQKIKEGLEGLVGIIPGLVSATVGINQNGDEFDAALIADFDTFEDLHNYDVHPAHQKVRDFVSKVRIKRTAVDYEY